MIMGEEIIRSDKVGIIYLLIYSKAIIILNNISYILKCNSKLILLG